MPVEDVSYRVIYFDSEGEAIPLLVDAILTWDHVQGTQDLPEEFFLEVEVEQVRLDSPDLPTTTIPLDEDADDDTVFAIGELVEEKWFEEGGGKYE
ncbi:MAG: hypothetical protein GY737_00140 [Desulfobacteraceae bacterium]|nr:hypothetical protein [Desulfobacteraceae bacterium]